MADSENAYLFSVIFHGGYNLRTTTPTYDTNCVYRSFIHWTWTWISL